MTSMHDGTPDRDSSADNSPEQSPGDRPRVGLALGGGAAFGGMHVGVILALEEADIDVDVVTGTSAGAFVGAFYAGGATGRQMADLAARLRWAHLRRRVPPLRALMSNDRMAAWLQEHLPATDFEAMARPFAVVATDVLCGSMVILSAARFHGTARPHEWTSSRAIESSEKCPADTESREQAESRIVWQSAPVPDAVAASCAIPVIFEPVGIGGRLLVDGSASAMIPATVARWLGADIVIAVDILPPQQTFRAPRTITEYAIQAHRIASQWAVRNRTINADVALHPRAEAGESMDMRRMKELIAIGYAETVAALPDIRRRLGLIDAMKRRLAKQEV